MEQRAQKKVRGWWHTLMQQVFFWYIMLGEGYFLTVCPEKEATDPKEVETQLERTGGLFQVLLQLIFVYD